MNCPNYLLLPLVLMLPFWGTVMALGPLVAYEVDLNRVSGLVVLLLLAWRLNQAARTASTWLLLIVAVLAAAHAVCDASDPRGLSQTALYASALVLGVCVATRPEGWERQLQFFVSLKLLALGVAFVLCQWAADALGAKLVPHPPVYLHTRLLSMAVFFALVLLLVVVALGEAQLRFQSALICGASMLAGYFTAWFAARGSLVAIVLLLATAWILMPHWRRVLAVIAMALVAGATLCVLVGDTDYLARRLARSHQDFDSVTSGRWRIWKECFDWWVSSPRNLFFGAGPDAFRLEAWIGLDNRAIQPHNFIVQVALEWGALGLGILIFLLTVLGRRAAKILRTETSPDWQKLVACSMPALFIYALVDGIFYHAVAVLPAAILIGLLFGNEKRAIN